MAYRFGLDETAQDGLRRIAQEQASKVLVRLTGERPSETMVHDCRKSLKRLKALLKLARSGLSKRSYNREYGVVRDAGRALSGARDLEVLPVTLASLCALQPDVEKAAADCVREAIEKARADSRAPVAGRSRLKPLIAELEAARSRLGKLEVGVKSFAVLEHGVADGMAKLCQQHRRALDSDEDEAYHDWRKSAQLHWRHMRLLSDCWPELLNARIKVAKGLADVLGNDHDLSVLSQFIADIPTRRLKAARRKALLEQITDRQQTLRAEARSYACLLVVDKPERFAASIAAYHRARVEIEQMHRPFCQVF